MSTRKVLSANLRALMDHRPDLGTLRKITAASRGKLSNGKLGRIRNATHATDINTLDELAEVFHVQTWQLLVPNLNPAALPQLAGKEFLESIRALVLAEGSNRISDSSGPPDPSVKKKPLGRLPGEELRTGQEGESSEVDRHAAPPSRGDRRGT